MMPPIQRATAAMAPSAPGSRSVKSLIGPSIGREYLKDIPPRTARASPAGGFRSDESGWLQNGTLSPLQGRAIPLRSIGRCIVSALQKIHQSFIRRGLKPQIFILQNELAQSRIPM